MKRYYMAFIAFETVVLLILFMKYHKLKDSYLQYCEIISKYENAKNLIEDGDCVLWGMCEDSVAEKLPQPLWYGEVTIKDDGRWTPPPYERYLSKVRGTKDSIIIHSYRWYNPFSKRTNVEVVFEEVDGCWVSTSCLEYNPKEIEF